MTANFTLKIGSQAEAKAIQDNYQEAQKWCNFILHEAQWFPDDVAVTEQSLRFEQQSDASSYRLVAQGKNRTLTIKQFLFDFAPPAYDHPNLWRNPARTKEGEFPPPKPVPLRENVLWLGHDHRRYMAGSIGLHRVRIELTVTKGEFTEQEMIGVFNNLQVADPDYAGVIAQTPFATLSHQARHKDRASDVPLSYWHHKRNPQEFHYAMEATAGNLAQFGITPPDLSRFGYELDSFFVIGSELERYSEIDFVFEQSTKNGAYLRLLVSPPHSPSPIPFHPEKYTQACHTKTVSIGDQDVDVAWLTEEYGPFEATLSYRGNSALLLAQPAAWTNDTWFSTLLRGLVHNP
jgi:hypothetical protein